MCKQSMHPSMEDWIKTPCLHTVEYYLNLKKEGDPEVSDNIHESWGFYAHWRKPVSGEQTLHDYTYMKSQMTLVVKNPPANTGDIRDQGSIPGLGRSPGEGNSNPLSPGKSHRQRSLMGYNPCGAKRARQGWGTEHKYSNRKVPVFC